MDIKCFKIVISCPNPISVILIKSNVVLKTLHSKLLEKFYSVEQGILFIWLESPGVQLGNLNEHSCGVISSSQRYQQRGKKRWVSGYKSQRNSEIFLPNKNKNSANAYFLFFKSLAEYFMVAIGIWFTVSVFEIMQCLHQICGKGSKSVKSFITVKR